MLIIAYFPPDCYRVFTKSDLFVKMLNSIPSLPGFFINNEYLKQKEVGFCKIFIKKHKGFPAKSLVHNINQRLTEAAIRR